MLQTIAIEPTINLIPWLQTQAQAYQCQWMLAHSLDCVIWGKFDDGVLHLGCEPQKLSLETLQQCRIFGPKAEVLLWNNGSSWHAALITDPADPQEYIDEPQILWGTKGEPSTIFKGFTTLTDGIQAMPHTLPLVFEPKQRFFGKVAPQDPDHRPARLVVRHILDFDSRTGAAYVRASRLVELFAEEVYHGERA